MNRALLNYIINIMIKCFKSNVFPSLQAAYPPNHYIRSVPQRKVHIFTFSQLVQLAVMCGFGFSPYPYLKMTFPILILLLLPVRYCYWCKMFAIHCYRPQTKFAKVMFLQVSVCPQGGACVVAGGHAWWRGCAWQRGACLAKGTCMAKGGPCMAKGGVHGKGGACMVKGHVWQRRGMCGEGGMAKEGCVWDTTRYGDTINERAVRILLECILVLIMHSNFFKVIEINLIFQVLCFFHFRHKLIPRIIPKKYLEYLDG